jgi:hypothetical protein
MLSDNAGDVPPAAGDPPVEPDPDVVACVEAHSPPCPENGEGGG